MKRFNHTAAAVSTSWAQFDDLSATAQDRAILRELAKRFDLNCYGCCEPLNGRWNTVKQIPNLRRVSVSPWADLDLMAEMLGKDYVLSYKPNLSALAMPAVNEADIRAGLRHAREVAEKNNCHIEVIMKDNSTLGKNAGRAARWCRIAREELLG